MALLITSLTALFFSFCLGQIARIQITPSVAITGLDILTGLFVIGWGVFLVVRKNLIFPPVWKGFGIFTILSAVSLLLNIFSLPTSQALAAFLYLLRFVLYGCLFFIIYSLTPKQKKVLQIFMIISGFVMVIVGYIQFFYYPALRNLYYAGWDEHFYRMFGTFLDPNFLGLFFVGYIIFLLFLLYKTIIIKQRVGLGLLLGITIVALFLTYSRTALIALLIGTGIFLFMNGTRKILYLFVVLILIGVIGVFLTTSRRSEGTNILRVASSEARLGNMKDAITVWQDNYLFGVGFDAYRYAQHRHGIYQGGWEEGHGGAGADNSFLFVLATTGIVGLAAYLYFLFQHIAQLKKQKDKLLTALGIATLLALSVGSFFINGLFYPSLLIWLWSILGITESR